MRHPRSDAYSAEQILLNKRQIYGGAPKVNCYPQLNLQHIIPVVTLTGQLANKPTLGQSSRGLVNSRTSQLAEMFGL